MHLDGVVACTLRPIGLHGCTKLALHDDEPPANLHTVGRRFDLLRRTYTIIDDNKDTTFIDEVQLKSAFPGHGYRCSSPIQQHQLL
jgi:hypothetical protein